MQVPKRSVGCWPSRALERHCISGARLGRTSGGGGCGGGGGGSGGGHVALVLQPRPAKHRAALGPPPAYVALVHRAMGHSVLAVIRLAAAIIQRTVMNALTSLAPSLCCGVGRLCIFNGLMYGKQAVMEYIDRATFPTKRGERKVGQVVH